VRRRRSSRRAGSGATAVTALAALPAAGTAGAAEPEHLTIDLATDTGAFHGGASGSLYGVYGDGVPSRNVLEGMHVRTVSTKAQDGFLSGGINKITVTGASRELMLDRLRVTPSSGALTTKVHQAAPRRPTPTPPPPQGRPSRMSATEKPTPSPSTSSPNGPDGTR
jgi:cell division septation protein DedD